MNRATVNKIFQKHPVYFKAGMIAVISIIIFGCVYSKDNGKKLEKDEKGREILRRNESGKDELKNMKVKIDEKQEDISISVSGKKYDEEELKNAFSEAEKEVEQAVLGKNKSLDEANKMDKLVKQLLELMKLEYGKREFQNANFNITELIQEVIRKSKVMLEENNIDVKIEMPNEVMVYADEFYIEQVVTNYFTNAIKHAKEIFNEKYIKVTVEKRKKKNKVRISIFNTGDNIEE